MLVYFEKATGAITKVIDYLYEPTPPEEGEDVLVTFVEHGSNVTTMRVDLATKMLVAKSAVIFSADRYEINPDESIVLSIAYEGEQFGETWPLMVGGDTLLHVPYSETAIQITIGLPGVYNLWVPDGRIYYIPRTITVREDLSS